MPRPMSAERWARLETLFFITLDLPPGDRARFVDAECGTDRELREELVSLLSYDTVEHSEVEAALGAGAAWVVQGDDDALAGRTMGAYRIERELGRGGMSVVYLAARDDGEFRKQVAVKLIKRGMDTDAVMERLRRERRILAALEHPYIARLLDGGTSPDGRPYIVMEYVEGQPVNQYCDANSFLPAQRCELIEKICEAVTYAHRNLVVHRDLKPANILITREGSPRLLDFGVARVLQGDDPMREVQPETRSLFQAFTPEYASPEQLRGASSGTAADVYSLGVILYELLSGVRPFGRETAASGREPDLVSVAAAQANLTRQWSRQLEGDLDNILQKALRREHDRRYLSVEQFQLDLSRHRLGLPVAARGDSILYRTGKLLRRHRFGSIAAAAAVLAITAGLAATIWQAHVAQTERGVAEKRRVDAERERSRAEEQSRQSVIARQAAEAEHAEADRQRADAEIQKTVAETQRAAAERRFGELHDLARTFTIDFENAIEPLAGAAPARKMLVETGLRYYDSLLKDAAGNAELLKEIANAYDHLGDVEGSPGHSNLGDRVAAMAAYEKAKAVRSRVSDDSPRFLRDRMENAVRIGALLVQKGDLPAASAVTDEGLRLAAGNPAASDPAVRLATLRLWTNLGDVKNMADDFEPALIAYNHLLEMSNDYKSAGLSELDGNGMISLANTKVGEVLAQMGRGAEALPHLRIALAIDEEYLVKEPDSAYRLRKMSVDYFIINYVYASPSGAANATQEEIRLSLAKAAEITDRIAAVDSGNITAYVDVGMSHLNYAKWYRTQEDYQNSLAETRKYYEAMNHYTGGKPHTMEFDDARVRADAFLARALAEAGMPDEALSHLSAAVDLLANMEKTNPGLPHLRHQAATNAEVGAAAWSALKNWPRAQSAHRDAIAILEQLLKSDSKDDGAREELFSERELLARDLANAGQISEARASLESALELLTEAAASRKLSPSELKLRADAEARIAALK